MKRELKRRLIYENRCDEKIKTKMRNLHASLFAAEGEKFLINQEGQLSDFSFLNGE
jgi:hypothetical protein